MCFGTYLQISASCKDPSPSGCQVSSSSSVAPGSVLNVRELQMVLPCQRTMYEGTPSRCVSCVAASVTSNDIQDHLLHLMNSLLVLLGMNSACSLRHPSTAYELHGLQCGPSETCWSSDRSYERAPELPGSCSLETARLSPPGPPALAPGPDAAPATHRELIMFQLFVDCIVHGCATHHTLQSVSGASTTEQRCLLLIATGRRWSSRSH